MRHADCRESHIRRRFCATAPAPRPVHWRVLRHPRLLLQVPKSRPPHDITARETNSPHSHSAAALGGAAAAHCADAAAAPLGPATGDRRAARVHATNVHRAGARSSGRDPQIHWRGRRRRHRRRAANDNNTARVDAPGVDASGMHGARARAANVHAASVHAPSRDPQIRHTANVHTAGVDAPGVDAPGVDAPGVDAPGVDAASVHASDAYAAGVHAAHAHSAGMDASCRHCRRSWRRCCRGGCRRRRWRGRRRRHRGRRCASNDNTARVDAPDAYASGMHGARARAANVHAASVHAPSRDPQIRAVVECRAAPGRHACRLVLRLPPRGELLRPGQ